MEPRRFTEWKATGNDDWQPSYEDLRSELKQEVRAALLKEQGWVCCYCERRVSLHPDSSHIEHLQSRSTSDESTALDYANLLCSCNTDSIHCGAKKGSDALDVHPLLPTCTSYFEFGSAGTIAASRAGDRSRAARKAIDVLGLGVPALEARRREACGAMLEQMDGKSFEEMRQELPRLLSLDVDGRFLPHAAAVVAVLLVFVGNR